MNVGHFPHKFRPSLLWFCTSLAMSCSCRPSSVIPGPQGWVERASLCLTRLLLQMRWETSGLVLSGRSTSQSHPGLNDRFCLNPKARYFRILQFVQIARNGHTFFPSQQEVQSVSPPIRSGMGQVTCFGQWPKTDVTQAES